jgi:hypothetical protein
MAVAAVVRRPTMLPDKAHHLPHLLGWCVGEASFRRPDGSGYWQVDASRDGQVILAADPAQGEAWSLALRMAGNLQRAGV